MTFHVKFFIHISYIKSGSKQLSVPHKWSCSNCTRWTKSMQIQYVKSFFKPCTIWKCVEPVFLSNTICARVMHQHVWSYFFKTPFHDIDLPTDVSCNGRVTFHSITVDAITLQCLVFNLTRIVKMDMWDHTLWVKLSLRVLQCVMNLKTTGAWVKFCKPWILVVYSRLTLGMVNEKLYCSDFYTTFWAGELLKPKNTHARDYKAVKYICCCRWSWLYFTLVSHEKA